MWSVSANWLAALSASHGRYTRMEAWFSGAKVADIIPESGAVSVTAQNGVRRRLSAVVSEAYWPTKVTDPLAPYGAQLKVFQGITGANGSLIGSEVPVFAGRVETVNRQRKSGTVTVTGADPMADVVDALFDSPRVPTPGVSIIQTIMSLVAEVRSDVTVTDLTGSTATVPAGIMWNIGGARISSLNGGGAIDQLAQSIGAEVFFLPDGVNCVIRPIPLLGATSAWSLVQGQGSTIVRDVENRSRIDVANRIVVTVNPPGGGPQNFVTVTDDDPASPTRYGGPYGKVIRTYNNPLITTQVQAQIAGQARLARFLGITRSRAVDHVPNPALEAGDLITVTTDEGTEQHIADSFPVPFAVTDVMTTTTRSTSTSTS